MSVKIITDSTICLEKELIDKYDVTVIPMLINYNNQSIKETAIDGHDFYEFIKKEGASSTTSQPPFIEIYQVFCNILEQGHDIIAIFISANFSGTYSTAVIAKEKSLEKYPEGKIEILDSRGTCMGYPILQAAKAAARGDDLQTIIELVQEIISRINFLFVPDTLEYLNKGGRIGGARYLLGSILDIKPVLTIKDGKVAVVEKVRSKKKALEKMNDILEMYIKSEIVDGITIGHVYCPQEALEIAKSLEFKFNRKVQVKPIGPVVGMHVGPGTIGIAYYFN